MMKLHINENIKESNDVRPYKRYLVKITPYKDMYKFDYLDNLFDKHGYCFFTYEDGYVDTQYKSISENLFYKLFDETMEPNKVYQLTLADMYGNDVIDISEVPTHWFHL